MDGTLTPNSWATSFTNDNVGFIRVLSFAVAHDDADHTVVQGWMGNSQLYPATTARKERLSPPVCGWSLGRTKRPVKIKRGPGFAAGRFPVPSETRSLP